MHYIPRGTTHQPLTTRVYRVHRTSKSRLRSSPIGDGFTQLAATSCLRHDNGNALARPCTQHRVDFRRLEIPQDAQVHKQQSLYRPSNTDVPVVCKFRTLLSR